MCLFLLSLAIPKDKCQVDETKIVLYSDERREKKDVKKARVSERSMSREYFQEHRRNSQWAWKRDGNRKSKEPVKMFSKAFFISF